MSFFRTLTSTDTATNASAKVDTDYLNGHFGGRLNGGNPGRGDLPHHHEKDSWQDCRVCQSFYDGWRDGARSR